MVKGLAQGDAAKLLPPLTRQRAKARVFGGCETTPAPGLGKCVGQAERAGQPATQLLLAPGLAVSQHRR